ncbi:hypothetical protein Ahy_A06g030067 isoform C [Arachis hypogaea]|uniref:Uncharacterized protein n=1 Tax=Arachis hypogaea TaxID=3818 RepID=A0A445CV28_ARAHY|nr:hypothetical protein Ahy_A06g030067 isoform C [Arachis hypogaea]
MRKLIHTLSNVSGDRLVSYVQEKVVTRMRQKIVQDVKIVQTNRNQQPRMKLLLHVHTPIRRNKVPQRTIFPRILTKV